ncbi:SLBB domain-containing protein [Sulfurospirillum sp. 1612]|uniref:SLBB domain-containing protein n=1 Tax=Sulfurospirillum sp. 1612 TaxID=3094835 RepID=UPI002F94EEC3
MIRFIMMALLCLSSLSFALDKASLIEAVRANPALLDTPAAQNAMRENGMSKADVTSIINSKQQNHDANLSITPKIENHISNEQNSSDAPTATNENKKNLSEGLNPLKFLSDKEAIAKIQSERQYVKEEKLARFGDKFFINKNRIDASNLIIPDYYIINKGDQISIDLYGDINKNYTLKVDEYGNINVPVLGPINVAGLSYAGVKEVINKKLKPTYPTSKILVKISANSSIQVSLTGSVNAPGLYNLPAVSTIKDLLIAAHGFGKIGSMREVYLKRNAKTIKIIDFYKLIKNGELVDTTLLRNGDIVFVPKAKEQVRLRGAVNIPAIYELKPGEKLQELIHYAGGIKAQGASHSIKIKRYVKNAFSKVLFKDIKSNLRLQNGDDIYVYDISQLNKDQVFVYGNIDKPGSYMMPKSGDLKDLLSQLEYLKSTYMKYGLIKRFDESIVSFDLNHPKNIKLKQKDTIYIFNTHEIAPNQYIKVSGDMVKKPGKFQYLKGMNLKDAINSAGILSPFDTKKVQITSYDKTMMPTVKFVNYDKNLNLLLHPYDEIRLYDYYNFSPLKPVSVYGEVNEPNIHHFSKNMTLQDLISMCSGFTDRADKNHIELVRYRIKNGTRTRKIMELSTKDLNMQIQPYDEVYVKRIPEWFDRKVVSVKGEVRYPGNYVINTGDTVYDVLKRAGGFNKDAYLYGAVLTRESVKKANQKRVQESLYKLKKKVAIVAASAKDIGESSVDSKNLIDAIDSLIKNYHDLKPVGRISINIERNLEKFKSSPYNITLENNDTIYIPPRQNSVSVMGEVISPTAFVYDDKDAISYIKKAGGITASADSVFFVVHANGMSEKGDFGYFNSNITVHAGDVIVVPIQIKTSTWYGIAKDASSILYQLAVTAASLKTVGAL